MIRRVPSDLQEKWLAACSPLLLETHLDVADLQVPVTLSSEQLAEYWLPLAETVYHANDPRRIIGIVGEPGAGKSVLSLLLAWILEHRPVKHRSLEVATFSIDGFHYPNDYLDRTRHRRDDGTSISLRKIKGSPWTYDVAALLEVIEQLAHSNRVVNLPAYSRQLHEPRANAIAVPPSVNLVLVEGNWLLYQEPPWDRVASYLDFSIYVHAPARTIRKNLISRHLTGRKTWQQVRDIYRAADRPNRSRVRNTIGSVNIVLTMNEKQNIVGLRGQ